MYELKVEAIKIIEKLQENGHEGFFVNNYPFVKCNNASHQNDKLKLKQIEIITNASLELITSLFDVVKVEDSFNKSVLINVVIKNKNIHFRIYYLEDYLNKSNNKIIPIKSIEDMLDNFGFLHETIRINSNSQVMNYINKKYDAIESIKEKTITSNGNFREKIMESPIRIFQVLHYASNINYLVTPAMLKVASNNFNFLKYEKLETIIRYFNMILQSKKPANGLILIKNYLYNFEYENIPLFKFLLSIDDEYLTEINVLPNSVDLISRWVYLLRYFEDRNQAEIIIDDFHLDFKSKILWMLDHYDIIDAENYKMAIYDCRDTLKGIANKHDIFLLYEMINRLSKLHKNLDNTKEEKCNKIIDIMYSRPFFTYQLKYEDQEIIKMSNLKDEDTKWLLLAKESLVKKILMCEKHPNDEQYEQLAKEAIEYGYITYNIEKEIN